MPRHGLLQTDHLVWQDERLRQKLEVFFAVYFPKSRQMSIHAILSAHFGAFREMVDFLRMGQLLVDLTLYVRTGPH